MATPHIEAKKNEIAKIVLMPGDPLRAKFIAEQFLTDVIMFNDIRNMYGFTGYYNNKRISVMGSGMGMPSMGIYSYELFKDYNVDKIIRIGSCGALIEDLNLFDVVLVDAAYSDSSYAMVQNGNNQNIILASSDLTNHIGEMAEKEGIDIVRGTIYSTDVFYKEKMNFDDVVDNYKCIATEMEAFSLFHNANVLNKEAACILTVSDSLVTNEITTSDQREKSFVKMVELALKSI